MVGRLYSASALALLMIAAVARPAAAQGYVAASILGDIARFNEYDTGGYESSGNGEAIGFALRLGSAIGSRWGVELEFARPSEIETELSPPYYLPILTTTNVASGAVPPGIGAPVVPDAFFPYSYRVETRQRNTTLSASVWIGQPVTKRFGLTYLAGIAFGRTSRDIDVVYEPIRPLGAVILPARSSSSATTYDVGPLVGVEGAIALTEHVRLIPGIRLHGVEGGWLLRPSAGLGWTF